MCYALGAVVLICCNLLCTVGDPTYVQVGSVRPYVEEPDVLYVQANVHFYAQTATSWPDVVKGELDWKQFDIEPIAATDVQSPWDVFLVLVHSDGNFTLAPLNDCWGVPGIAGSGACCEAGEESLCFNQVFTMDRCCRRAKVGAAVLRHRAKAYTEMVRRFVPTYGIRSPEHSVRRLRWRWGHEPARCSAAAAKSQAPGDSEEHPDFGMLKAFRILSDAGLASRRVLQVGTNDGKSLDPLYPLIVDEGVAGLGLEADEAMAQRARQNLPEHFKVIHAEASPLNIWALAKPMGPIDLVVVDIDSFECALLESLVDGAHIDKMPPPALLYFELNTAIPPPFKFSRGFDARYPRREKQNGCQLATTSCSLSYAVQAFGKRGYDLLSFGYDTIFVRRDLTPIFEAAWPAKLPMDEFECYEQSEVTIVAGTMRMVREWYWRAHDPFDLQQTLSNLWQNITAMSQVEGFSRCPFSLFL